MQVRMRTTKAGPESVIMAGQVVDLPRAEAMSLVNRGFAEHIKPKAETTVSKQPQETAVGQGKIDKGTKDKGTKDKGTKDKS